MAAQNDMPSHYKEMNEGLEKDLHDSGWGEKFAQAQKEGITPELIFEYQLEYARELINLIQYEEGIDINEKMKFVTYMVETYVKEEEVRRLIRKGINSPGAWAYLTACYFE